MPFPTHLHAISDAHHAPFATHSAPLAAHHAFAPMERSQLPQHLCQRVEEQQKRFELHLKQEANRRALREKPLPRKTSCKWTKEERRWNNKLSVSRSRVRERETHKILDEELARLLFIKKQLQDRYNLIHAPHPTFPLPMPFIQPYPLPPMQPEQCAVTTNEHTFLDDDQHCSEWSLHYDEQTLHSDFSPITSADTIVEQGSTHHLP